MYIYLYILTYEQRYISAVELIAYRSLSINNKVTLITDLNEEQWLLLNSCNNIDDKVDTFSKLYLSVWNNHMSLKRHVLVMHMLKSINLSMSVDIVKMLLRRYSFFMNIN